MTLVIFILKDIIMFASSLPRCFVEVVICFFSGSALFIKTKNHMRACPLINPHVYILFLLKSSNILTNIIASKDTSILSAKAHHP